MIPDEVWDILEERGVVPAPKLPEVGKVIAKARERNCSVQMNYPADDGEEVYAVVSRVGQTFTGAAMKDVESVAIALAECLKSTEEQQMAFALADADPERPDLVSDDAPIEEKPKRKRVRKNRSILDEAAEHLDAVGESQEEEIDEAVFTEGGESVGEVQDYPEVEEPDQPAPDEEPREYEF
jgi:hypothetical protein